MKQKTEHLMENILGIMLLVLFLLNVSIPLVLEVIQVKRVGMFILLTIGFIKLKELAVDKCSRLTARILKGVLNTIFVGVSIYLSINLISLVSAYYVGIMLGDIVVWNFNMLAILFIAMLLFIILMGLFITKCVRKFLTRLKEKEVLSSICYLLLSGYTSVIYFGFIVFTLSLPFLVYTNNTLSEIYGF